jgi:hypothetical protein
VRKKVEVIKDNEKSELEKEEIEEECVWMSFVYTRLGVAHSCNSKHNQSERCVHYIFVKCCCGQITSWGILAFRGNLILNPIYY